MITAIAIDDEPLALGILEEYCNRIPSIDLVKTFTNLTEAKKYIQKFPVDLIFLDIQMPDMLGTEFYKQIKKSAFVVFTTAHEKYALEAFDLQALDYLLKPISFDRFHQTYERVISLKRDISTQNNDFILVRSDYTLKKILLNDIYFIEGLDDYVIIHTHDKKPIITKTTMKKIYSQLPSQKFIRIHRSYIISLNHVDYIRNKFVYIHSKAIPIGSSYEKEAMLHFRPQPK